MLSHRPEMTVDQQKLRKISTQPPRTFIAGALRREGNAFFIDGGLPAPSSLDALFESHCQSPADLFCITFTTIDVFSSGEELARLVKKNFSAHVLGRFEFLPSLSIIERAYAAGVDIIDIPLGICAPEVAREPGLVGEDLLPSMVCAQTIFPRWSVASTLVVGDEPLASIRAGIDYLLSNGILPLIQLSEDGGDHTITEISAVFEHLWRGWCSHRATIKPLQSLINLTTPFAPLKSKGLLRGIFDKVHDKKLLAASDLRRSLRVRQIEQSFESAGL